MPLVSIRHLPWHLGRRNDRWALGLLDWWADDLLLFGNRLEVIKVIVVLQCVLLLLRLLPELLLAFGEEVHARACLHGLVLLLCRHFLVVGILATILDELCRFGQDVRVHIEGDGSNHVLRKQMSEWLHILHLRHHLGGDLVH